MSTSERALALAASLVLALAAAAAPAAERPKFGQPIAPADIAPWDISIGPDGAGLPPGSGTPAQGAVVFEQKCQACHGEKGAGTPNDRLVGGRGSLASDQPVKTVGSYWPYATTLFDYVRRAMPWPAPKSLTDDEVYAVTAYILRLNDVIGDTEMMTARTLPKAAMPNRDGFVRTRRIGSGHHAVAEVTKKRWRFVGAKRRFLLLARAIPCRRWRRFLAPRIKGEGISFSAYLPAPMPMKKSSCHCIASGLRG